MADPPPRASPQAPRRPSLNIYSQPSLSIPPRPDVPTSKPALPAQPPPPPQNPVFRALGLPNIRPRLPSRNWSIFLAFTTTITGLILYDKRQTRLAQAKWCGLVSQIADEPLPANQMPRRIRIYVQAPPGDNLGPARELFYEYVKPVLVAGAMEWDVVEARREGDVRWAVAEGIRKRRRKEEGRVKEEDVDVVEMARERAGTREWENVGGELVLGRHAWKEVVRGLHEGWLGPVDKVEEQVGTVEKVKGAVVEDVKAGAEMLDDVLGTADKTEGGSVEDGSPVADQTEAERKKAEEEQKQAEEEEKRKKLYKPPPYNKTADYASAVIPRSIPNELGPTTVLPFPHLLGFLGTPTRVYRFFTRRNLADEIGRQTAALVLASSYRPFDPAEQESVLKHEEEEWHKSIRRREPEEGKEDVWKDRMVLDERIAGRMRTFVLSREDDEKAQTLAQKSPAV